MLTRQWRVKDTDLVLAPSMFGRDLIEQTRADARGEDRMIPVIVEKCIMAVEAIGEFPVSVHEPRY